MTEHTWVIQMTGVAVWRWTGKRETDKAFREAHAPMPH